jgi:hypothetical protein
MDNKRAEHKFVQEKGERRERRKERRERVRDSLVYGAYQVHRMLRPNRSCM